MFKRFVRTSKSTEKCSPPTDLKEVFAEYTGGADRMTADQLHRFLVEYQGEVEISVSDAEKYIQEVVQLHKMRHGTASGEETRREEQGFSLDDFFHFLSLDYYNGPIKSKVHHDMNAPLSHYFMYTGHNSYLTGNQLSSDSSDVPIIKALQRGVRVIELDLWPNSSKEDVSVLHGRTLTTPVTFIQCLKSIKEYAFVKSPYPVIITLEDHLTVDLQAKAAEMLTQTFGDILFHPETDCLEEFPSPESLKHRIIISTKPPSENDVANKKSKNRNHSPSEKQSSEETASESPVNTSELGTADRNSSDPDEDEANESDWKSEQKAAPEYKRLITIHAGKPKKGLSEALRIIEGKVRRLSLSEQKLEKAAETHGTDLVRFTQKNILRVYPKGTRVTSSNFRPHIAWMHGAQMVAFNMQGYGKSLSLMHGMFRANGGSGYLKKPEFLMQKGPNDEIFDPERNLPVQKTLKVKVYMGDGWSSDFSQTHFDTFSPPDFYTKVCIVGVPADCSKKKTKVIFDDWCPVWNEEFKFPLTVPQLAVLRIEVGEYDRTEKDDFGGQTYLPVSELRHGFRSVPLYDKKGDKYNHVKLFMQFLFE